MLLRPPRSTRTDTLFPYTTLFRSKLKLGMTAYFTTLGQPDKKRFGKLRQILPTPQTVNNVILYSALFDVTNPDHDLMTSMSAQVFFVVSEAKDLPIVPLTALRQLPNGRSEARRVGTGCVSPCRIRWGPSHEQTKNTR